MRLPLLGLAGLCLAACQPESDKTNPAIASDESVAEREAAAPAMGANSFTEEQARDRITAAGYTDVTGLAIGQDGVWRGTASMAGQSQSVSLDYQGNVTPDSGSAPSPSGTPATPSSPTSPPSPGPTTAPGTTPSGSPTPTEPNQ